MVLKIGFDKEIIIGTDLGIRSINSNMTVASFIPNAPASSKFTAIEVLDDGRLIGASSNGLSIKDFDGWRNILEVKINGSNNINNNYNYNEFIADTIPYDFGDAVSDIEQGPNGLVYVAIEGTYPRFSNPDKIGGGILVIDIDNTEIELSMFGMRLDHYFAAFLNRVITRGIVTVQVWQLAVSTICISYHSHTVIYRCKDFLQIQPPLPHFIVSFNFQTSA